MTVKVLCLLAAFPTYLLSTVRLFVMLIALNHSSQEADILKLKYRADQRNPYMIHQVMKSLLAVAVLLIAGCATTGYNYARDPSMVKKFEGTVVSVNDRNIYNGTCWSLNPLPFTCPVESVGLAVKMVLSTGETLEIVQPKSAHYTLKPNDRIFYVVDQGRVWAQPIGYPLPPEFIVSD